MTSMSSCSTCCHYVCVARTMEKKVWTSIIMVSRVFRRVCAKFIDHAAIKDLRGEAAIASCIFEKEFPTS